MNEKKARRMRRAARTRRKIRELAMPRLCVHRTPQHTYVQLISEDGTKVLASASTLEKAARENKELGRGKQAAGVVGKMIAERVLARGIKKVAFDRSGFLYHGRVKALADAAREGGLDF